MVTCRLMVRFRLAVLLAALVASSAALGQGGPPLITDDPATVPTGKWEVNLAWASEHAGSEWRHEAPILDYNHGIGPRQHINFEVPWSFLSGGGLRHNGVGNLGVGSKWRFLDAKGGAPAMSLHPAVEFGLSRRSARLGLSDSGTSLAVPMEIQWELPGFAVNADVGMALAPGSLPSWLGGVAVGRSFGAWELLAEIHGMGVVDNSESDWIGQLGFRYELGEGSSILFAAGKSLRTHGTDATQWTSYLALQLRF